MSLFSKLFKQPADPAPEPVAPVPEPVQKKQYYDFIIKSADETTDKALQKYQKFWTDPEDKYDGMKLMEFKEEGSPGDKVYQYPPLDVSVKLEAFIADEDGAVTISGFINDGDKDIYVGTAAKTKAKKILKLLQENNPKITGELYGGKYWKMEDSGYVDDRWTETLTVRVYLEW